MKATIRKRNAGWTFRLVEDDGTLYAAGYGRATKDDAAREAAVYLLSVGEPVTGGGEALRRAMAEVRAMAIGEGFAP